MNTHGRTDAVAEALILCSQRQLIGKDPDAGKDWRQKEKTATEDEMAGMHHRFNGHELGQIPGDGEGKWSLTCCSTWDCRVRHNLATDYQQHALISRSKYVNWRESWKENWGEMGKTRDLFKKIRDTKGTFHVKMCSIKDRNDMDLTEA